MSMLRVGAVFLFLHALLAPFRAQGEADSPSNGLMDLYLTVLNGAAVESLPLADDVEFMGSALEAPFEGAAAVKAFLSRVQPALERIEVRQITTGPKGGCLELVAHTKWTETPLEEVHCLGVEDGQITRIRLYFDPRPLLGQP